MDIPSTFISMWTEKIKLPTDPNSILQAYLADHTPTYNNLFRSRTKSICKKVLEFSAYMVQY